MHQMQVMVSLTFALALYCAAPASNNSDTHGGEDAQLGSQKASIEKNTGSFRHLLAASSQTSWPEEYDVLQSAARARGRILLESNRVAGVGAGIFVFFLFLCVCKQGIQSKARPVQLCTCIRTVVLQAKPQAIRTCCQLSA